jgi:hypothetical protein
MSIASAAPIRIKIPVWQVAKESYRSVFGHLPVLVRLARFPALLIWIVVAAFFFSFFKPILESLPSVDAQQGVPKLPPGFGMAFAVRSTAGAILLIALIALLNLFAVRWHRFILLGERTGGTARMFDPAWQRFTFYVLIIYAPDFLETLLQLVAELFPGLGAPFASTTGVILDVVVSLAWMAFTIYAFGCTLVFPAAALGQPMTWQQARQRLHGNFWRLVGCCIVVGLLGFLTCVPILLLFTVSTPPVAGTFSWLALAGIGTIYEVIFVALFVSILCGFYRRIVLAPADP